MAPASRALIISAPAMFAGIVTGIAMKPPRPVTKPLAPAAWTDSRVSRLIAFSMSWRSSGPTLRVASVLILSRSPWIRRRRSSAHVIEPVRGPTPVSITFPTSFISCPDAFSAAVDGASSGSMSVVLVTMTPLGVGLMLSEEEYPSTTKLPDASDDSDCSQRHQFVFDTDVIPGGNQASVITVRSYRLAFRQAVR